MKTILMERNSPVFHIRFNRPERLNAVNQDLYKEFLAAMDAAEQDETIRVVVLAGEGRAFCVGADLKDHAQGKRSDKEKEAYTKLEQRVCLRIQQSAKPFIAAVHGYALGAGAEIALACDFVVMTESAQIGFPETGLGTFIGGGLTVTLPLLVGLKKARELIMLGDRINGTQAEEAGLIYKSVKEDQLISETMSLGSRIAGKAPLSIAMVKKQLRSNYRLSDEAVAALESESLFQCMKTEDWAEGARAFTEKRAPKFRGT
ncbi:MAG: enoyl-CoA hydratase/isomerase family protein [Bacteroidetes bacterium]|nr:enoyl-CoA hydratase/isomerase family protein [Bacteroidota bacterium]